MCTHSKAVLWHYKTSHHFHLFTDLSPNLTVHSEDAAKCLSVTDFSFFLLLQHSWLLDKRHANLFLWPSFIVSRFEQDCKSVWVPVFRYFWCTLRKVLRHFWARTVEPLCSKKSSPYQEPHSSDFGVLAHKCHELVCKQNVLSPPESPHLICLIVPPQMKLHLQLLPGRKGLVTKNGPFAESMFHYVMVFGIHFSQCHLHLIFLSCLLQELIIISGQFHNFEITPHSTPKFKRTWLFFSEFSILEQTCLPAELSAL